MIIKKVEKYIKESNTIAKLYVALIRSEALINLQDNEDVGNSAYNEALRDLIILIKEKLIELGNMYENN